MVERKQNKQKWCQAIVSFNQKGMLWGSLCTEASGEWLRQWESCTTVTSSVRGFWPTHPRVWSCEGITEQGLESYFSRHQLPKPSRQHVLSWVVMACGRFRKTRISATDLILSISLDASLEKVEASWVSDSIYVYKGWICFLMAYELLYFAL